MMLLLGRDGDGAWLTRLLAGQPPLPSLPCRGLTYPAYT